MPIRRLCRCWRSILRSAWVTLFRRAADVDRKESSGIFCTVARVGEAGTSRNDRRRILRTDPAGYSGRRPGRAVDATRELPGKEFWRAAYRRMAGGARVGAANA